VTGSGLFGLYFDSDRDGKFAFNKDRSIGFFGAASESSNAPISSEVLPAIGTYFVAVEPSNSSMMYDLTAIANPLFPSSLLTEPGSEPTTAYNLGILNKGGSFEVKDYVGQLDATDIFRFTLPEASKVTFGKVEFGDSIDTRVYQDKNNNNILDSSDEILKFGALFGASQTLAAGTYFVSALLFADNSAYTLTVAAS
jgi:hypothetical protein